MIGESLILISKYDEAGYAMPIADGTELDFQLSVADQSCNFKGAVNEIEELCNDLIMAKRRVSSATKKPERANSAQKL